MVATTYKQTDIGNIPNDWEVKILGELAKVTKLAGFEYSLHFNSYNDGGEIIVIRGTNITHSELDLSDIKTIPISTSNKLLRSKLYKNDLVFAYVGTIGPVYLVEENDRFHLGPNTSKITVKKDLNSNYLFHYFKSSLLRNEMNDNISIGAQPSLSMSKIRSFRIITPPLHEQQLIAQALSNTNALITNLQQLIAKKQQIKQGAMQQLLKPKEGWEVKPFKDLCWFQEGPGLRNWQFTKKGIKVINVTNLENGILNLERTNRHISLDEFHSMYEHFEIDENDIVIASSGNSYGKVALVRKQDLPLVMNTSVIRFKPTKDLDYNYLWTFLKSNEFKNQIDLLITGGAQPNFGPAHLNKISISIPPTKEEQTQIATILSDMDNEINALETKLLKYKNIKQGMMQNLLTGKIRLV